MNLVLSGDIAAAGQRSLIYTPHLP